MAKALIIYGGWEGHKPFEVATFLAGLLEQSGIEPTLTDSLNDIPRLQRDEFQLVVPVWTMEHLEPDLVSALLAAVRDGVGLAALHGVIDSFRHEAEFHLLLGGQWVTHFEFAVRSYEVTITAAEHPVVQESSSFEVTTEQYYLLVDPVNNVLATMDVDGVQMPVAWTKSYGKGRVFYCSLGHDLNSVAHVSAQNMIRRGMLWSAGKL